jgi:hypothetical protein
MRDVQAGLTMWCLAAGLPVTAQSGLVKMRTAACAARVCGTAGMRTTRQGGWTLVCEGGVEVTRDDAMGWVLDLRVPRQGASRTAAARIDAVVQCTPGMHRLRTVTRVRGKRRRLRSTAGAAARRARKAVVRDGMVALLGFRRETAGGHVALCTWAGLPAAARCDVADALAHALEWAWRVRVAPSRGGAR